jgi:hypothetical protein
MGRDDVGTRFWYGHLKEGDHWGDPDIDKGIILGWISGKCNVELRISWCYFRIGPGGLRL